MQPGADRYFDPGQPYSPVSRETAFARTFFERVAREMQVAKAFPMPPAGDGSEYDAEEAQQERYRKLGARRGSRFLNIGVDNQVTWPAQETLIKFDKYQFVLMPKTETHVQSIHVDLTANHLTDREAMTIINRFLSIMTWCDDQFAIAQDGWSGNPVPVPVRKRDLAFMRLFSVNDSTMRSLVLSPSWRVASKPKTSGEPIVIDFSIIGHLRDGSVGFKVLCYSVTEAFS
jgi:hypothetical protein